MACCYLFSDGIQQVSVSSMRKKQKHLISKMLLLMILKK
jgi:hypothetical protein